MKILFVTQWFAPEPGVIIPVDIAKGLADLGHEVHVLTGFPNYPKGKLLDGYSVRPYQREKFAEHITVHRAPLYPSHDQSMARRGLNYLSFAAGATAVAMSRLPRCDVALVYSSPATAALPAMVERVFGLPYVLLIQDLWPDSVLDASFVTSRAAKAAGIALGAFCTLAYRGASRIAVISPGMGSLLVERGVPKNKIAYTPNWISDAHLDTTSPPSAVRREALGLPTGRSFIYAGNLGDLQNLPYLIRAFAEVPEATLVLVGDGVMREELNEQIEDLGASNISLHPPLPLESVGAWLAACDVQVVSLRNTPLMRVTMPSKVQTSLATGRPTLVVAAGDPATLVRDAGAGWATDPDDVTDTVATIRKICALSDDELHKIGAAARCAFDDQFSFSVGPTRLAQVLQGVSKRP